MSVLVIAVISLSVSLFAQSPDRSKPPVLGPTPSLKVNALQNFTLSNGLKVVVYEKKEVPIIQMNLVVKAGSVNESPDKLGLAGMTANMMDEGAAGKTSLELSDEIDYLGAEIGASGGLHNSGVSLRSTVSKFDAALKLFTEILLHPDFPATELERLKKQYITSLFQGFDQPRVIAAAASSSLVYGKEHQYGRTSAGNEKTISSFTSDDLKKFYSTYYRPNNAFLVVVGDVNAKEVVAKIESALAGWQKADVKSVSISKPKQVDGRNIYLIDKPEAAQSVIRICRVGVDRKSEDYFPIMVMNTILGGSFTSRLNTNLREENHYAYGASSGFSMRPLAGPFTAASDVQTDKTDKALNEFMKELNGISKPVSDEELMKAKNYLALGYPDNFSSVGSIAAQIAEMVDYELPESYFNEYIAKVLAVTKDDVRRVAKKYIDTDDMAIIIVGDKAKVEKGLKETKVGKIINMVPTDVLGPMPKL
ncbi:MAG: insulinase family protein [Bacteroidetes bacterium]|nr:insulinase family protein [Bacteroidota bacterium]